MNILHLTNTTLAGAPGMLSEALNAFSKNRSILVQFNDKGPNRNLFQPSALYLGTGADEVAVLRRLIDWSDVIHIHNIVPTFVLAALATVDLKHKKTVYQIHSPCYEPPIFKDVSGDMGIDFDHHLVLGHYHARQHPDFEIVPNCLYRSAMYLDLPRRDEGVARIVFSPSSGKKGRWGAKSTPEIEQQLQALAINPRIKVTHVRDMPPETLMLHRKNSDISIDEVLTGAYHLVSYEGMACGNVVINNCDDLNEMLFKMAFQTHEIPPFFKSTPQHLLSDITCLTNDRAEMGRLKAESHAFFWDVMAPDKVVSRYCDIYARSTGVQSCSA